MDLKSYLKNVKITSTKTSRRWKKKFRLDKVETSFRWHL